LYYLGGGWLDGKDQGAKQRHGQEGLKKAHFLSHHKSKRSVRFKTIQRETEYGQ